MTQTLKLLAGLVLGAMALVVAVRLVLTQPLLILALVSLPILWRWPAASIVALLIATQEVPGFYSQEFPLLSLGHQVYGLTVAGVPVLAAVIVLSALSSVARFGAASSFPRLAGVVWVASTVLIGLAGLGAGTPLVTILGSDLRSFFLLGSGALLAWTAKYQPGGLMLVAKVAAVGLTLQLMVGLGVFILTGSGRSPDGQFTLFYNSTMPFIAGAAALAIMTCGMRLRPKDAAFVAICVAVVLLSGRRNVWLAVACAYAVSLVVRSGRFRRVVQATLGVAMAATAIVIGAPGLAGSVTERVANAFSTVSGGSSESSTAGHVDDITFGLRYAPRAPTWGYGHQDVYLPGLFRDDGSLYVHNEILQAWLRFGLVGLGVAVICTALALSLGTWALTVRDLSYIQLTAAFILVMAPVSSMTAPFFQTTQQWPVMLGFAALISASAVRSRASYSDDTLRLSSATTPGALSQSHQRS